MLAMNSMTAIEQAKGTTENTVQRISNKRDQCFTPTNWTSTTLSRTANYSHINILYNYFFANNEFCPLVHHEIKENFRSYKEVQTEQAMKEIIQKFKFFQGLKATCETAPHIVSLVDDNFFWKCAFCLSTIRHKSSQR